MGLLSTWRNLTNFLRYAKEGFYLRNSVMLGQKGAVWLDVDVPSALYDQIPQLATVVDRRSDMFSNMELFLENIKSGERVDNSGFYNLIQNPNPLQSMNEWLKNNQQQKIIYGNQFLLKKKPSSVTEYPILLWNVSPAYCRPVLTGKLFDQTSIKDIVLKYEYQDANGKDYFDTENVLWSRVTDKDNPLIGQSKLYNLKFPLTNTKLAYEYRNVIMGQKGAIGILSNQAKDSMGAVPLSQDERKRIQDEYINTYGVGEDQSRVLISEASLSWTPMSYPTKDMLLFEEIDANFKTICEHLGLNINIFFNSTYENVKNGIIQTYQDTIIPEADQFAQALTKFLGVPEGLRIRASYDHLQVLKADEKKEAETLNTRVQAITQGITGKLFTPEMGLQLFNEVTGMDLEFPSEGKIIDALNRLSPLVANNVFDSLTDNQVLSIVGLPPVAGGDVVRSRNTPPPNVGVNL